MQGREEFEPKRLQHGIKMPEDRGGTGLEVEEEGGCRQHAMGSTSQTAMTTMPMTATLNAPNKGDRSPGYLSSKQ